MNYLDTEMLPWWLTPNSAALCVLWHNVLFLLMESVEILEPTNILNDPVFLLYIRVPWQMRQSPKNAGSALPTDVSPAMGTVWKARFISQRSTHRRALSVYFFWPRLKSSAQLWSTLKSQFNTIMLGKTRRGKFLEERLITFAKEKEFLAHKFVTADLK